MITRLSERKATELKPRASSYEVRDGATRGLVLRVGVKGQKVWEVVTPDGKTDSGRPRRKRTRLGVFPDISVKDARKAAEAGVIAPPLSSYYRGASARRGLLLGYAGVSDAEMRTASARLTDVLAATQGVGL